MDVVNAKKKADWDSLDNRDGSEEQDEHFKDPHWGHQEEKSEPKELSKKAEEKHIDKPATYKDGEIDEAEENTFYLGQVKAEHGSKALVSSIRAFAQTNAKEEEASGLSQHLGSIEAKVKQIAGEYARLKEESVSKDEQLKSIQEASAVAEQQHNSEVEELRKQLETKPEGKDLDKDQVARLATMLKQLA